MLQGRGRIGRLLLSLLTTIFALSFPIVLLLDSTKSRADNHNGSYNLNESNELQRTMNSTVVQSQQKIGPSVYVFFNGARARTGGPATLHEWHSSLLHAGFESDMYEANVAAYGRDYPNLRGLKRFSWQEFQPGDVVVVAEYLWANQGKEMKMLHELHRSGVRIVVLVLGISAGPEKLINAFQGWTTMIPLTRRMGHVLNLTTPGGFNRPMLPRYYNLAADGEAGKLSCSADLIANVTSNASLGGRNPKHIQVSSDYRTKSNLVLVDDDTQISDATRTAIQDIGGQAAVQVYQLKSHREKRLSYEETACVFASARVYLDGGMPGFERGPMEAALFGAVPVLPIAGGVGADVDEEFPARRELRADFSNEASVLNAVELALQLSQQGLWKEDNSIAMHAKHLQQSWRSVFKKWTFGLRVHLVINVPDAPDMQNTVVLVTLAWTLQIPMGRIYLIVRDPHAFRESPAGRLLQSCNVLGGIIQLVQRTLSSNNNGVLQAPDNLALPPGSLVLWIPPNLILTNYQFVMDLENRLSATHTTIQLNGGNKTTVNAWAGRWDLKECASSGQENLDTTIFALRTRSERFLRSRDRKNVTFADATDLMVISTSGGSVKATESKVVGEGVDLHQFYFLGGPEGCGAGSMDESRRQQFLECLNDLPAPAKHLAPLLGAVDSS